MNIKVFIVGILLVVLAVGLSGCEEEDMVVGTGEVRYVDLEGGFYGIISDDGEHYDPTNLPSEFKEGGLRISFKLKILENQIGFHMWGTIVEVLEIEKM